MLHLILVLALLITQDKEERPLAPEQLRRAGEVAGLEFSDAELELMLDEACENLESYRKLWGVELDNAVAPVVAFSPILPGMSFPPETLPAVPRALPELERPESLEELAFADIPTLASLIRSRKVSCAELTEMYLARLKRFDPQLLAVVTLCEERARAQARALDLELERGEWRGLLHGIPWGAKDLLATRGVRTTWGAEPYQEQVLGEDAAVVERLDAAGAVLIAKLSLGALAMGDVWFGGKTRNPWKPEQGSSGSSAGPAAATAAGCVAFAIGSETCGSILSPSARCGCSSLRPTFGRVSRRGAMALAWSMDKLGPICRSAGDAAIVFAAIQGPDPRDESTVAMPFADLGRTSVKGLTAGYVKGAWRSEEREQGIVASLEAIGLEPLAVELPDYPVDALMVLLSAEAATAFDELTRSGRDDLLARQDRRAWPTIFRAARLIPAVEYIRANRVRRLLMQDYARLMERVDVLVHPTTHGATLVGLNMTGHPTVCVPASPREDGTPRSLAFTGRLFAEGRLLAVAEAWQERGEDHRRRPPLFAVPAAEAGR